MDSLTVAYPYVYFVNPPSMVHKYLSSQGGFVFKTAQQQTQLNSTVYQPNRLDAPSQVVQDSKS
jgi:hypothetical protein